MGGGSVQQAQVALPTSNFTPVNIGGNLAVAGNVGTGPIVQQQKGQASGAKVSMSIPMMPLQNLQMNEWASWDQLQNLQLQELGQVNLNGEIKDAYLIL